MILLQLWEAYKEAQWHYRLALHNLACYGGGAHWEFWEDQERKYKRKMKRLDREITRRVKKLCN